MADWVDVVVPRGNVSFPSSCPACLAPGATVGVLAASDMSRLKGFFLQSLSVESVPYCAACAAKFKRVQRWVHIGAYLGLVLGIAVGLWTGRLRDGLVVAVLLCVPLAWTAQLHTSVRIRDFDEKSVVFRFSRAEYAAEFRRVNGLT